MIRIANSKNKILKLITIEDNNINVYDFKYDKNN